MKDRRQDASTITPEYEDNGIFKNAPGQIVVELVPRFGTNSRNDLMIKGFAPGNAAIDVVFAGRRQAQAGPLVNQLKALWTKANKIDTTKVQAPQVDDVRLPVRIEGAWRPRFARDDQGWQTRTHQLFAARWLISDSNGEAQAFGEPVLRNSFFSP